MSTPPRVSTFPRVCQARAAGLLALVGAGAHATALAGGFVWDDYTHLAHALVAPFDLREVFLPGARFRPLLYLPGGFDAVVWGERAAGWHLTTLLLHAACTAAVFLVLRRLLAAPGRDGEATGAIRMGAVAGAALFAVHPATTEVAAWIMGRGDSLSLLLGLLAAYAAMARKPLAMSLLVLGSLLAKETGVVWLVLAPACARVTEGDDATNGNGSRFALLGGVGGAAVAYAGLRTVFLQGAGAPSLSFSLPALLGATGFYARAAFLPLHYMPFVEDVPTGASFVAAGMIAMLASAGAAVVAYRRRSWIGGLAIAGAWLALLPAILTAGNPVSSNAVADRHLYAALPWLALGAGMIWEALHRRRPAAALLLLTVVLGLFAGSSLLRGRVWHDERTLWAAVLRDAPESRYAWGNLGLAAGYDGDLKGAESAFTAAQRSGDPHPFLRVDTGAQLAMIWIADGRTHDARVLLDRLNGIPADADGQDARLRAEALHALAVAPGTPPDGDLPPRAAELASALAGSALRRRDPLTAWHLGAVLENRGDRAEARDAFALVSTLAGPASRGLARKAEARGKSLVTEP